MKRSMIDEPFDIDLGDEHVLKFFAWAPDRSIQSNAERFAGVPDVEKWGASVSHRKPDGEPCAGFVTFESDVQAKVQPGVSKWKVECWEPLTLSPSLLCSCGDHGFVRSGKWVRA